MDGTHCKASVVALILCLAIAALMFRGHEPVARPERATLPPISAEPERFLPPSLSVPVESTPELRPAISPRLCRVTGTVLSSQEIPLGIVVLSFEGGEGILPVTTDPQGAYVVDLKPGLYSVTMAAQEPTEVEIPEEDAYRFDLRIPVGVTVLRGRIVDGSTGEPVPDVALVATDGAGGEAEEESDEDGTFEMTWSGGSRIVLLAEGEEHLASRMEIDLATANDLVIELKPEHLLRGQVWTPESRTVSGAEFEVRVRSGDGTERVLHVITDDQGRFALKGLEEGTYEILLESEEEGRPLCAPQLVRSGPSSPEVDFITREEMP